VSTPERTIPVPVAVIANLFDMGNYGTGKPEQTEAVDVARNIIRHTFIELKVLGDCIGANNRTIDEDDLCSHCWRLSAQLEAALEIVDAMLGHPFQKPEPDEKPEAAE